MGAVEMGVPEDELQGLINDWRNANTHIVKLWTEVGNTAMKAIKGKNNRFTRQACVYVRARDIVHTPAERTQAVVYKAAYRHKPIRRRQYHIYGCQRIKEMGAS